MSEQGLLDRCRVVPVVVLDHPDQALPLGKALLAGGIDVIEITLRTDAGLAAIRQLGSLPGMLVGAGSVLVSDQVDQVVQAGARFVVSPGLSADVVLRCCFPQAARINTIASANQLPPDLHMKDFAFKAVPSGRFSVALYMGGN